MATDRRRPTAAYSSKRPIFRPLVGLICLFGGLAGLLGLYLIEIPEGNREPLLLSLGLVLGWGSAVVQSEYGSTATGRRVVEGTVRRLEAEIEQSHAAENGDSDHAKGKAHADHLHPL